MTQKLAIIDQSIRHAGGHHLEYALRVAEAADAAGFTPVLGVNHKFDDAKDIDYEAHGSFKYTFWENLEEVSRVAEVIRLAGKMRESAGKSIKRFMDARYFRFLFSSPGLDYQRANEIAGLRDPLVRIFASDMAQRPSSALRLRLWRATMWGLAATRRVFSRLGSAWSRMPRAVRTPVRWLGRLVSLALRVVRKLLLLAAKLVFAAFALPFVILASPVLFARSHRSTLRRDLKSFIRKAKLREGDIVFVPTLGETEMLAIADLCAQSKRARGLRWRLLFRRNIYSGRPNSYGQQNNRVEVRRLRLSFNRLQKRLKGLDFGFFTDTEALTEQYNMSGIFPFHTATIPVSKELAAPSDWTAWIPEPVVAGYFGDARDEKGYPLLAEMMDHLHSDLVGPGRLKLLAQSNFNLPGGEPGSAEARLALGAQTPESHELVYGPFKSDEYAEVFRRADILLIPYHQDNYAARSSGVFAEALALGRPTVVTRGTWMAMTLEHYRQAYLERVSMQFPQIPAFRYDTGRKAKFALRHIHAGGEATYGDVGRLNDVTGRTHLHFRARFRRESPKHHIVVTYEFFDASELPVGSVQETLWVKQVSVQALTPIPAGVESVKISLRTLDQGSSLLPDQIEVVAHKLGPDIVCGFAGRIVAPTAYDLAEGVREITDHYAAYRDAAEAIAPAWRSQFSAERLVEEITGEPSDFDSPESDAADIVAELYPLPIGAERFAAMRAGTAGDTQPRKGAGSRTRAVK